MRFLVRASRVKEARKSLAGFAKKAAKLGLGALTYSEGQSFKHTIDLHTVETGETRLDYKSRKASYLVIPFEVDGIDRIKLGEWQVLGSVAVVDGVRIASPMIDGEALRSHSFRCDHCNEKRARTRNYLLRNAEGAQKWIGTSCLSDYTGHTVANALSAVALYDALFLDLREKEEGEGSSFAKCFDLEHVLAVTNGEISRNGFVPATSDHKATKNVVFELVANSSEVETSANDKQVARNVLAWIEGLNESELTASSYLQNAKELVHAGYVTANLMGLTVSLVASFTKAEAKRKELATAPISKHIGTKGKRETFVLSYKRHVSFPTEYGTKHLIFMTDDAGNVVKWGTTNFIPSSIDLDRSFKCTATVKEHSDYKGVLQTEVARAKFEQPSEAK